MEIYNTLNSGVIGHGGRMTGRTTRQIDEAIQKLFQGFELLVMDHHDDGANNRMNKRLLFLIVDRMNTEHKGFMAEFKMVMKMTIGKNHTLKLVSL